MIRAIRPAAVALDDASLITGWNVSPNVGYTVVLTPGSSACGALLFDADMQALIASGAGLVGTDQPVVLLPQTGTSIGMVDADLGWHMLVTTDGTEAQQTIRIGPAVDLPDEIHPIYTDDNMALARATAAINAGASYVDDVTVTCPRGFGASVGDTASVPVDGSAVVGQVESVTWSGSPDGTSETAVIRRHTAIAPDAYTPPPAPPVLADDTAETDAATATAGNVLANDTGTLTVVAVNGLSASVGQTVTGSNGGDFVINADGAWAFDPSGDFAALSGSDTATTSVSYHASNGQAEASATLTVTVSAASGGLWTPAEIVGAVWVDADTVTLNGSTIAAMADKIWGVITASQSTASAQPTLVSGGLNGTDVMQFDGADWLSFGTALGKPASYTVFVVGLFAKVDGAATYHLCGMAEASGSATKMWGRCAAYNSQSWYSFGNDALYSYGYVASAFSANSWFMQLSRYTNGQNKESIRINGTNKTVVASASNATSCSGTAYEYSIGRLGSFGNYCSSGSRLKGFVCVPSAISDADAARLEGYYAHLCGLESLLPIDHPCKSAPPTI